MATPATCHALTTHYISLYQGRYNRKPLINRNRARWGWDNILEDLTPTQCRQLLEYYFSAESSKNHSIDWFFHNYDKLIEKKKYDEADAVDRAQLRAESKKRVEEWRKRGNFRGEDSSGGMSE